MMDLLGSVSTLPSLVPLTDGKALPSPRLGRIDTVYRAEPYDPANLVLYLVRPRRRRLPSESALATDAKTAFL